MYGSAAQVEEPLSQNCERTLTLKRGRCFITYRASCTWTASKNSSLWLLLENATQHDHQYHRTRCRQMMIRLRSWAMKVYLRVLHLYRLWVWFQSINDNSRAYNPNSFAHITELNSAISLSRLSHSLTYIIRYFPMWNTHQEKETLDIPISIYISSVALIKHTCKII